MSSLVRSNPITPTRRLFVSALVFAVLLLAFAASEFRAPRSGTADLPSKAPGKKHLYRAGRPSAENHSFARAEVVPVEKLVSFNKPAVLDVGRSTTVQAVLSAKLLTDPANVFRNLSGEIETTGPVTLGAFVTAKLTAPPSMLEITSTDTSLRKVEKDKDVVFVWYVRPLRTGSIPIDLAVVTQDQASADAPVQMSEVMHQDWRAKARGVDGLLYWIKELEPIRVALWTLISGIGSLLTFFGLTWVRDKKTVSRQPAA